MMYKRYLYQYGVGYSMLRYIELEGRCLFDDDEIYESIYDPTQLPDMLVNNPNYTIRVFSNSHELSYYFGWHDGGIFYINRNQFTVKVECSSRF